MVKTNAYVLEPTYKINQDNEQTIVHLWCRLQDGRTALVKKPFKPYFFIKTKDEAVAKKNTGIINTTFEKTTLQSMTREPVTKIITLYPGDVPKLRDSFENQDIECYEADIRFAYRAMMDWGVHSVFSLSGGKEEQGETVDVIIDDPDIFPVEKEYVPALSVFSFDIESNKDTNELFCISSYGAHANGALFEGKFIISKKPVPGAKHYATEKELLEGFVNHINEIDPDVITGWNVIDFDLHLLQTRMKYYKVKFTIGRDGTELKLRLQSSFFRDSSATIKGRLVLDGMQLLKNSFVKLQDYKLDTAAKKFAKEEKLIQSTGQQKYLEIKNLYDNDKEALLKYNLLDAKLAFDVIMNSGSFPLTIKRSLLVGMPLDRVNASIATLDSLYLRELRSKGFVAPVVGNRSRDDEGMGGFVMQSKPGIYDYVIVCDFKSLYPSLMRTFNIDPLMFVPDEEAKKGDYIEAPNGAHFRREQGIIPGLIHRFWDERERARKAGDELARYAIKIHMNSIYGVLASPNCRFFNRQVGNAITSFAQHFIKLTAEHVEEKGFEVIYGDTDSVFVNLACDDYTTAQKMGKDIEKSINTILKKHIEETYKVDSFMELEFEKTFIRFIMPKVRGAETGAKKRYAGLVRTKDGKEDISFTGLEMVRRDWTNLAKEFQYELYKKIFAKEEVASYVKQFVQDVKDGKMDDKLIYRRALRKGVEEYTKTTPPHVKAAMKIEDRNPDSIFDIIEYVMTTDGPEPVQNITHNLDYDHYIDKQIKPIADAILGFYNTSFDEQISGLSQASLFDF